MAVEERVVEERVVEERVVKERVVAVASMVEKMVGAVEKMVAPVVLRELVARAAVIECPGSSLSSHNRATRWCCTCTWTRECHTS